MIQGRYGLGCGEQLPHPDSQLLVRGQETGRVRHGLLLPKEHIELSSSEWPLRHLGSQTSCLPRPPVTSCASCPANLLGTLGCCLEWCLPLPDHSLFPTGSRQFPSSTHRGFSSSHTPRGQQVKVFPQHWDPQFICLTQDRAVGSKLWKAPPRLSPEPGGYRAHPTSRG